MIEATLLLGIIAFLTLAIKAQRLSNELKEIAAQGTKYVLVPKVYASEVLLKQEDYATFAWEILADYEMGTKAEDPDVLCFKPCGTDREVSPEELAKEWLEYRQESYKQGIKNAKKANDYKRSDS